MRNVLSVTLNASADQLVRLRELQAAFAEVCNAIAPVVQRTRCWNRVALHHLVYHPMRERFPALGSQMVCNAVYSVCRAARAVFQHPKSPWYVQRQPGAPLPLLHFAPTAPVYFDRHTLSLRGNALSLFTLDGRMRLTLALSPQDAARFQRQRLGEIALNATAAGFELVFQFVGANAAVARPATVDRPPDHVAVLPPDAPLAPPEGRADAPPALDHALGHAR